MSNNEMYGPFQQDPNTAQLQADQAREFILSKDPKKAMGEMIETLDALHNVYIKENETLKKADTRRFLELQTQKIQIAKNYQSGTRQLLERKADFVNTSPEFKRKLLEKQDKFNEITATNLELLGRVKKSVVRLNDRIMDGVRKEAQKESVNYQKTGKLDRNERPLSIGINESA